MRAGDIVDQRFAVERLAAAGGMGAVYLARDLATGAPVALKVLLGAPLHEDELRFEREALALAELDHPGVVRHVAHGVTAEGLRYLAMEWIDGEDLAARIGRAPLSIEEAAALGQCLGRALGAAHARGIVHRDLKPSNILLASGELGQAKIVDFGLAKLPEVKGATLSGTVLGTPAYMAPEQAHAAPDVDARADVFSLGCILHECLTGRPAFAGQNFMAVLLKIAFEEVPRLRDLGCDAPVALDELIARMMSKDPARRPAGGGEVAAALAELGAPSERTPGSSAGLGRDEVLFASIVLAQPPPSEDPDPDASTIVGSGLAPALHGALAALESRGARPVVLRDGTIAWAARGPGLATDHAALAAEQALALRAVLPGWAIAVTTGHAEVGKDRALGEAIERTVQRLRARRRRGEAPAIDLDDVTAGMLDPRFQVASSAVGFELLGEQDLSETARTLLGRPTPFVGRDREIDALLALYRECVEDRVARAALVSAPPGFGKSRLRHELVQRLCALGAEIWIARGEPLRAGAPFGMLAPMIRRAARVFDGDPLEAQRQKILAHLTPQVEASERRRVAEFLGELVGTRFPDEGRLELRAARQDPQLLADQMRRAWVDFVRAAATAQPVVLVLEDLHWGDAPSADYVDAALRLVRERPLLVLGFARAEVHDRLPRLWQERGVEEIRLHELPRRACERLTRAVLGERATPEVTAQLCGRAAGNAFFLEELLRATAERPGGELPETVLAMVASRLEGMDPTDRRILRAASVFGEVFWRRGVAALLPDVPDLGPRLARLGEAEWIAPRPETRFRAEAEHAFRHALVRETAYGMLTDEDRALGHRLAGAWLEAVGEGDAALLAEHFERGGEAGKARRWYTVAAERARARHAYAEAERLYGQALDPGSVTEVTERATALRGRGLTRYPLGRYHDALADFSSARSIVEEQGDLTAQIEILLDEATALDWMGDFKSSQDRVEQAQALLPRLSSPLLGARVILGVGRSAMRFSRSEPAVTLLREAARAAEPLGDDGYETLVIALLLLGFLLPGLGRLQEALDTLCRVVTLCEVHGDRLHLAGAVDHRGLVWGCLGDKARMAADMERGISLAREIGQRSLELSCEFNVAETLLLMDDDAGAEPHVLRARAIDRQMSGEPGRPVVALLEARLRLFRGDVAGAVAITAGIRRHLADFGGLREPDLQMAPSEEVTCAMVELATGDADAGAWDALESRSEEFSVGQERIEVVETRALAAQRRGRLDEARRHLLRALDLAARIPNAMGARLQRRLRELG